MRCKEDEWLGCMAGGRERSRDDSSCVHKGGGGELLSSSETGWKGFVYLRGVKELGWPDMEINWQA